MTYFSKSWVWNQFKLSKSNLSKNFELQLLHLKNLFIGFISITFQSERIICFRFFFCLYSFKSCLLFVFNQHCGQSQYLFIHFIWNSKILSFSVSQVTILYFFKFKFNIFQIMFTLLWEDNYHVLSNIILPSSHFLCTKKANYFWNN
jgi:hypothetical protein